MSDDIEFRCGQCGESSRVTANFAGGHIRCPRCEIILEVPGTAPHPLGIQLGREIRSLRAPNYAVYRPLTDPERRAHGIGAVAAACLRSGLPVLMMAILVLAAWANYSGRIVAFLARISEPVPVQVVVLPPSEPQRPAGGAVTIMSPEEPRPVREIARRPRTPTRFVFEEEQGPSSPAVPADMRSDPRAGTARIPDTILPSEENNFAGVPRAVASKSRR